MFICDCLTDRKKYLIRMGGCDPDFWVICAPDVGSDECDPEVNMCAPDYGDDGCMPDCSPTE